MLESSPQWSLVLFVFQQYFVTKKTEVYLFILYMAIYIVNNLHS